MYSCVDGLLHRLIETLFLSRCHTATALSVSLRSPPSPRGKGFISGIAVFSFRSLPHWGRGTAPAVDRVRSFIVDLRCISSPSFIPLEPYPARSARHLPHAGKALYREKRYSRIAAFHIGEGGPRQRWIGCFRKRRT